MKLSIKKIVLHLDKAKDKDMRSMQCIHNNKNISIVTSLVFIMLIFVLAVLDLISPMRTFSENENRMLAQKPEFSFNKLFYGGYTLSYEKYVIDQFVYRDSWISIKTIAESSLLKNELNGVYIRADGYLIEAFYAADVDKNQLSRNEERVIEFAEKYEKQLGDGRVKIMLVPTASDILSAKLPAFAEVFDQQEVIRRIKGRLSSSAFVDVTEVLKSHLEDYVFYRTDHHWTSFGAYYAYEEWVEGCGFTPKKINEYDIIEASQDFRGTIYSKLNVDFVKPDSIYLFKAGGAYEVEYNFDGNVHDGLYELSHLDTKDKYSVFLDGNHPVVKIDTNIDNERKLLIIKDSYANCFAPFAASHFESVYLIDLRHVNISIYDFVEQNNITDVLLLYNVKGFTNETTLYKLAR